MTPFAVVARSLSYPDKILQSPTTVSISVEDSFEAHIEFTLLGKPWKLTLSDWQHRGFQRFIQLFHDATPRDIAMFGAVVWKQDGSMELVEDMTDVARSADGSYTVGSSMKPMTVTQKLNAVEQGCKDVVQCLNIIGEIHARSLLEYCVWYSENHLHDTYARYITRITSLCVLRSSFVVQSLQWQLVEFVA